MLIPSAVLADLLAQRGEQAVLLGALTVREREVLRLMADGLDNGEVAERLGIRYGTVRSHVRNLIAKLNAHSKMEAVVRAEELGLIER
jgi:DNA-binding NarL/FixJ family response regulator